MEELRIWMEEGGSTVLGLTGIPEREGIERAGLSRLFQTRGSAGKDLLAVAIEARP